MSSKLVLACDGKPGPTFPDYVDFSIRLLQYSHNMTVGFWSKILQEKQGGITISFTI